MNTTTFMQVLPWLGWLLLLLGWLGQRRSVQNWVNKITVIGHHNQVSNQISHTHGTPEDAPTPALLERLGSWASIVGLLLTLWPLLQSMGKTC